MKMSSEIHVEAESHVRIEQNRVAHRQIARRENTGDDIRTEQVDSVESMRYGAGCWKIVREERLRRDRRKPFRPVDSEISGILGGRRDAT